MTAIDLPLRSPALYNPHLLSKEELVGLFSARQALLEQLLQDLRTAPPGEPAQHHLVVGQRGMGKTMLLRRLRYAVEDDPALRDAWLPLSFPEEQYNVAALSDFWLNCVGALTDRLEAQESADAVDELDRAIEELRTVDDEGERARGSLDLLTATAKKLGKRLLLLVDNADLVLDRIGGEDEEWAFREVLSSRPAVTFVGVSAAALESAYEYGKAFYDFFRVHELEGLDEEETRKLIVQYAEAQDKSGVRELIEREPERLRTLHTLTGGNPRTLVLLFNIFAQGAEGDVRADLERLLDQCTPLYKARFEALPAQAQQVVDALALHWDPVSAGELAEAVRLPVNTVSAQLNRLVREGIVEKVPYEPASKTGFQIAERSFNIWYLMRASRRVRRRLIWLVEFLRMFYGQKELRERVRRHIRKAPDLAPEDRLRHAELSFALAYALEDEGIRCVLERSGLQMLMARGDLRSSVRELVDFEAAEPELKSRAEYLERFERLRHDLDELVREGRLPADLELDQRILRAPLNVAEKERLVAELGKSDAAGARWKRDVRRSSSPAGRKPLQSPRPDAPSQGVDRAIERISTLGADDASSLDRLAWVLFFELGRWSEAEAFYRAALHLSPDSGERWAELGLVLHTRNRHDEAEKACRRAIKLEPGNALFWNNLGNVLNGQGRTEEAEEAYRKSMDLDPAAQLAVGNLGDLLRREQRLEEAEELLRRATEARPELSLPWLSLGQLLEEQNRREEAEEAYRRGGEAKPAFPMPWEHLVRLLETQGRRREQVEACRRLIELDSNNAWAKNALAWGLFELHDDLEEAESLARQALELKPDPETNHTLACILVRKGKWNQAVAPAMEFLRAWASEVPEGLWSEIVTFFREAVAAGKAREAAGLLDELDLGERWRPLREALESLARDSRTYLRRVAPEVRKPAEAILEELTATGESTSGGTGEPEAARTAD